MSVSQESVEILVELGLTQTEARLYTALLCLKSATARNIHRASRVARQDVYQQLSDLLEKGLIEKIIEKPAKFRPIAPSDAIAILTQRKNERSRELKEQAIKHFRDFDAESEEALPIDGAANFVLLPKSETNPMGRINKLGKAIDNAQTSVMQLTTFPLFMRAKFGDEHNWKKAVARDVQFKVILYSRTNEKSKLDLNPVLEKSDHYEIRWTSAFIPACMLLIDGKEAFYRIGHDVNCPVLWSTSPQFVALSKDYFKMKWETLERTEQAFA